MEKYAKYIPQEIVIKLKEKGVTEQELNDSIAKFTKLGTEKLKLSGTDLDNFISEKSHGTYKKFLRTNNISVNGIILGLRDVRDNNAWILNYTKSHAGEKRKDGYVVEEGKFPWNTLNSLQGQPIPDKPDWQQQGTIGIEYESPQGSQFYFKQFTLVGSWLNDSKLNNLKVCDKVKIQISPNILTNNNSLILNSYKVTEPLSEQQLIDLVESDYLRIYRKSVRQIAEENYSGFAIIKGGVGTIENRTFDIVDNVNDWDPEKSLNGIMNNIDFQEGATDIIFIGDVFKQQSQIGFRMTVYKTIVPEQFKRKELNKEAEQIVVENYIDTDEDLLSTNTYSNKQDNSDLI